MRIRDGRRPSQLGGRHCDGLIERIGRVPAQARGDFGFFAPGRDHPAEVLAGGLTPVPHIERMHAVVSVAVTIHVDVSRVVREFLFELLLELGCFRRFGQTSMEKLDVTRMMLGMELVARRVAKYHGGGPPPQAFATTDITEVPETG